MIRKAIVTTLAIAAMFFGVLSLSAQAQGYSDAIDNSSIADAFISSGSPQAGAAATTDTADATADTGEVGLAFTGAETAVLGYIGAGMIGLGSIAFSIRRRLTDDPVND